MIDLKQLSGILNTDDPNEVLPLTHHKMAMNGRFRGNGNNMQFQGVPGTTLIPNNYLPSGSNQCIGSFYDGVRQRIIWFNWNSNSKHGIYQYDINNKVISKLLACFTNSTTDILNFDLNYPIPSVVMLYRTEGEGDILHWTDRRNRPMKLNLLDAENNTYGSNWITDYLTVARPTPPLPPTCTYVNDATVALNNLRSKLYQFRYRFWYKDNTKSTWGSYSKLFAPLNPDDLATNIDPTKNNRIDITINTGNADVIKIEIAGRHSIVSTFSDCFLIASLDKVALSIADNSVYTFQFFNDSSYPDIDPRETTLLWSNVPQLANTLELLNGNVIIYGAPTEGYDFNETLDAQLSVTSVSNSTNATLNITQFPSVFFESGVLDRSAILFTFSGDLSNVSLVTINLSASNSSSTISGSFSASPTGTLQDLIDAITAAINSSSDFDSIDVSNPLNTVPPLSLLAYPQAAPTSDPFIMSGSFTITFSGAIPTTDVNIAMFHPLSKYQIGIVYFDEFDETDGVVTASTLIFKTPEVDTTGQTQMKIPQINLSINSQPPIWAVKFSIVFTNSLTYGTTLPTVSSATGQDGVYGYLDITAQQTNQNKYPSYGFVSGDRVRIIGRYGNTVTFVDVPLVSLVTNPNIAGTNKTGSWLKVPYSAATMSSWGTSGFEHYNIEIYTPAINTTPDLQFFYEVGQEFPVINSGLSNRAHGGMLQDQIVGTQPAKYSFTRGDFYIRTRVIPFADNLTDQRIVWIIDQSVSDQYPSMVKNNGRAYVVDESIKNQIFPTRSRWGEAYQQNTNVNQTNIFYPLNLDEIDRSRGMIQRYKTRDRILRVFQERACAQYGVYARYIQNNDGQSTLVTTDNIITTNNINYYEGEFGLGSQYCSLVSGKIQDYLVDPVRGNQIRLSGDGIIVISEIYKGQYFIKSLLTPYNKAWLRPDGSSAKILGCYDFFEEQYMCILQGGSIGTTSISNYAFSFNEKRNAYCSFYDILNPDWITSAEDKMYAWKNGQLYSLDNESKWANIFGVQYYPSINLVFNDKEMIKRVFNAIAYQSNKFWVSDNNGDIRTSMINPQTGLQQISQLKEVDYEIQENIRYAALLRDANSMASAQLALVEGDFLNGNWIEVNLIYKGSDFVWLQSPYLSYQQSPRNF